MEFPSEEYWSGLPFPSPAALPIQGSTLSVLCFLHWKVKEVWRSVAHGITKSQI